MPKHTKTIFLITIIFVVLFLAGIFTLISLFPPQIQTSITNNTQPRLESNSTPPNTTLKNSEPQPSFTGAIIVGITRPVTILGQQGFSPPEVSIKAGDSITWKNADPQHKKVVFIFQRGREQNKFFNSPVILPEQEWEYVFWEEGEYNYWTTQYGVEGKVIVTPCKNRFCPRKE
ncbi:MAG: hypothetical protein Q7K45_04900 [Nanoarchaeota archaeon]|nr:hypothetical protein [Nanoarchaeota archaeon]